MYKTNFCGILSGIKGDKMQIKIIYEDLDIIVVEKPPGIPSQKDPSKDPDVTSLLKMDYLGVIHRLDRPVGGVMVYAKTKEANSFLSKGFSSGGFHKEYLAVVSGKPNIKSEVLTDYLKKDPGVSLSRVVNERTNLAKKAVLDYTLLATALGDKGEDLSLLKVILRTGRHHQIRVQLANINLPIWGDTKYNKEFQNINSWTQISLWAYFIKFRHPSGKKKMFYSYPKDSYPWTLFSQTISNLKVE